MSVKITNVDELRVSLLPIGYGEYYILLHGSIKSSKEIDYIPKTDKFLITNLIDGTIQRLSVKDFDDKSRTNIGEAMRNGCFYQVKEDA